MKIGCHVSIQKGIDNAIYSAIEIGANAVQVFLSPPQGASPGKPISNTNAIELQEIIQNSGVYVVVHGKYVLNFCRRDLDWQHKALVSDLRKANQLGAYIGVVIHQGKNVKTLKLSREEALENYVHGVESVLEATKDIPNPIYLENSCQQGTELGYTLEELAEIWKKFKPESRKRLGFCLDTCHAFVAGSLQLKTAQEVDDFFNRFDSLIGLSNLKLIHFNDSNAKFNAHNDNHDDILAGFIGNPTKGGTDVGLKRVVMWAKKYDIPLILEIPGSTWSCLEQVALVNEWADEAPDVPQRGRSRSRSRGRSRERSNPPKSRSRSKSRSQSKSRSRSNSRSRAK